MMKMLRFRGASSSSSSPSPSPKNATDSPRSDPRSPISNSSPSAATICATPGSLGPAKPLRLVYSDDKGKFRMDPEAVAMLQLVKGPVGVVAVCGRARQGKSFILNQLLGKSSGFQVDSTHRPCTKGLLMWSAPLRKTAPDGTEYSLLLLDSEGIDAYDHSGTYSIQIFSLAVLLSSLFIYNQMGGIDEAALDRLSLVTKMTKHIRARATDGRSTASELGEFSPIFIWLLRDFYLDLTEGSRKITPRDYLELALTPVQGDGNDIIAKNEIREFIRALFPERECFTLVRPLIDENELRHLDQIPLNRLRKEFRSGLKALTTFVFERTRPKQVGATLMTGPILAGITQSFLDAINNGAVPTIFSSWKSVEETECRKAFDFAAQIYMSSFGLMEPADEEVLREAHENAIRKSLVAFNSSAVGADSTRLKYEKDLKNFCSKSFEGYARTAYLEADMRCSSTLQNMERKLMQVCHVPDIRAENAIKVLNDMLSDYTSTSRGPNKWKILATFLSQCLKGPIVDLFEKQLHWTESEKNTLTLRFRSNEDKLGLLQEQLDANEKHRSLYLKRFEDAVIDRRKISEDLTSRTVNLQSKCSTIEERSMILSKDLDLNKNESSMWGNKYDECGLRLRAALENFDSQKAVLESRYTVAGGRLVAAREQMVSAQEEALKWKQKYEDASGEVHVALESSRLLQEQATSKAQEREDARREELNAQLAVKEEEIKNLSTQLENTDSLISTLGIQVEGVETKVKFHEEETLDLKNEIKQLLEKVDTINAMVKSYEKESQILEQERKHLEEKLPSETKRIDEADERFNSFERNAKRAAELADAAQAELFMIQKEKSEVQHLALERLAVVERAERQIDNLEQEKARLMGELERLRQSETDAVFMVYSHERRVEEREKEIEYLLSHSNEQRSNTIQVLESLLAAERAARSEADTRVEVLSLQLQATQRKLDILHQEMASIRVVETALDTSKLRTVSRGKRFRRDEYFGMGSVQDTGFGTKRSNSTTSPLRFVSPEVVDNTNLSKTQEMKETQF